MRPAAVFEPIFRLYQTRDVAMVWSMARSNQADDLVPASDRNRGTRRRQHAGAAE
jgi:hypothetical protein